MNQMEGRKKATEMPIGPTMSLRSLYSSVRNLERVGLRYAGLRLGITQRERNQQGIGVGRSRFLRRRFRLGLRRFCTLLIDWTARTTMQRKRRLYDSDWDRTINSWTSLFHFEIRSLANNGEKARHTNTSFGAFCSLLFLCGYNGESSSEYAPCLFSSLLCAYFKTYLQYRKSYMLVFQMIKNTV